MSRPAIHEDQTHLLRLTNAEQKGRMTGIQNEKQHHVSAAIELRQEVARLKADCDAANSRTILSEKYLADAKVTEHQLLKRIEAYRSAQAAISTATPMEPPLVETTLVKPSCLSPCLLV